MERLQASSLSINFRFIYLQLGEHGKGINMEKRSIAIRVRKLLIENGFDWEQANALALVFDEFIILKWEKLRQKTI